MYLLPEDMPEDRSLWDAFLIALFGAADRRQIDGLGGSMPTTSKCCIVGRSTRPDADLDYTFAQIGIGERRVYWDFNCGNLTPSVGTFAVMKGLIEPTPPVTRIRVHQTNTDMLLAIELPTAADGSLLMDGPMRIAGVSGTGAPVLTDFSAAVGASLGGELLPTGNRVDVLRVDGIGDVRCSIVDLANMCVFFHAEHVGLTGFETVDQGPAVVQTFVAVREAAQRHLGIDPAKTTPWPMAVAAPRAFTTVGGERLEPEAYDVAVRFAGIQPMRDTLHEAYPGTASCCTAVAAVTAGTVVHEACGSIEGAQGEVRLGHPSGVTVVEAAVHDADDGAPVVDRVTIARTVRPLMEGTAWVRRSDVLSAPAQGVQGSLEPAVEISTARAA